MKSDTNLKNLENSNIRSDDLFTGDTVNAYLSGDISRQELKKELVRRRKEATRTLKGIDKLLEILPKCPKKVEFDD